MRRECSVCRRGYDLPGTENNTSVSHGYCGSCYFVDVILDEARSKGLSLDEFLNSTDKLDQEIIETGKKGLEKELSGEDKWNNEGEWKVAVDEDAKRLLATFERLVASDMREKEKGKPTDRR